MEKKEVVELVKEIMKRTRAGFMSTLNEDGLPEIRAIENFWCPELYEGHPAKVLAEIEGDPLTLYISTNTSSKKMKQIKENPNVAIYYSIPEEYKGVMFQGKVEIMDDVDFKRMLWYKSWTMFYPKGHEDPDFTILKLKPKRLKAWRSGIHDLELSD